MRYEIRERFFHKAFSLMETITALTILAFISTSVLVVIDRCMAATADSALRMQAFEVARENMEKLLASDSVQETAEYGYSDKYPEIQWQSTVESFSGPSSLSEARSPGWVRAICSAGYTDMAGEEQKIELVHWLTDLTKKQWDQIAEEKRKEEEMLAQMTEEERARWQEQKRLEGRKESVPRTSPESGADEVLPDLEDVPPELRELLESLLKQR